MSNAHDAHTPVLVHLLEFGGYALAPPLPLECLGPPVEALAVQLDERPVQVEQGDLVTRGWVKVDAMQTRPLRTEGGFEPLKGRARGCARFGEKGVDWWWWLR